MMKLALSPAAAGLLRALLSRAGIDRDRILLTEIRSVDWQSLTFIGERHEIDLRVPAPAAAIVERLRAGLDEADLVVPGQVVADIALAGEPVTMPDGALSLTIEALTIAD